MKRLLAVFLLAPFFAFLAPVLASAADTTENKYCPFDDYPYEFEDTTDKDEIEADQKAYDLQSAAFAEQLNAHFDAENCGVKANSFTGFYEKGDCAADGRVITEIYEIIAPDTSIDADNQIISLYAGNCCLASNNDDTCEDEVTIYTDTYTNCDTYAEGCERRQWIIGDSGAGIIQVVVKQVYMWGAFAVGGIAVMTMVLQGVKISMSGVSGDITESKNKILQAIAGIVLLFLSSLILYTVNPQFFS